MHRRQLNCCLMQDMEYTKCRFCCSRRQCFQSIYLSIYHAKCKL